MMSPGQNEKLRDALLGEDHLGAVIKGHLYIEAAVNLIIELLLPYPNEFRLQRLQWGKKVELVLALGLSDEFKKPLNQLGDIRNKFAHNPEAELTDDMLNGFYGALSGGDRSLVLRAYKLTEKMVENPMEVAFKKLALKNQFSLIVVTIHELLVITIEELSGRGH